MLGRFYLTVISVVKIVNIYIYSVVAVIYKFAWGEEF